MKHHRHSFEELRKVGRKYYNDTNFCSVVAVAVAAEIAFGKARAIFKKHQRRHRQGTYQYQQKAVLADLGLKLEQVYHYPFKTLTTAERFFKGREGTFFIYTSRHVTAIRDGIMEDWAADGSRKRVLQVYKVVRA